jgi:hypothetical protein
MRKLSLIFCVLFGTAWIGTSALNACGDKFLLIGRGAGFQKRYAAVHPASILMLVPAKSDKALAIGDPEIPKSLRKAGHKVEILNDQARLTGQLNAARYDIVLADFSDAVALESEVRASNAKPALVPMMYQPSKAEMAAAEKQFICLLKAPEKITYFLNVIDDLMKTRLDAAKAATSQSK